MTTATINIIDEIRDILTRELPSDLLTSVLTTSVEQVGQRVEQLHVHYRSGNEWIPVSTLANAFKSIGDVLIEYRGRGTDEKPKLVFEVTAAGRTTVQVIFHFAGA